MDIASSHLAAIARAEAERMRAAIADAERDAKVSMTVAQFGKVADLIQVLCDRIPAGAGEAGGGRGSAGASEGMMTHDDAMQGARSLAQIESDMVAAEAAFADADARLRQAERDRHAAIEALNRHQSEVDAAIARLRLRSPEGSTWHRQAGGGKEVLMLENEESSDAERTLIRQEICAAATEREAG